MNRHKTMTTPELYSLYQTINEIYLPSIKDDIECRGDHERDAVENLKNHQNSLRNISNDIAIELMRRVDQLFVNEESKQQAGFYSFGSKRVR